jgi:streptomycin 3"-kinase
MKVGLPAGEGEWVPTPGGESGAAVFHDRAGKRYAKVVAPDHMKELAAERDRTHWLDSTDVPSAVVLDWRATDVGACLITRAVPGVPADQLDSAALRAAWPSVVETVRILHTLPSGNAPSIGASRG